MIKKETSFIDLKQVKIDDPFFSRVQNVVIHTMLPYQERVLHDEVSGIRKSHVIKNFRIAAGDEKGTYYGRVFQDSDLAKWLEAVAYSLTVEANPELEARADAIIDLIGRAQQPDGYLDTYFIAAEPEHKWQNLTDCHEILCRTYDGGRRRVLSGDGKDEAFRYLLQAMRSYRSAVRTGSRQSNRHSGT